MSAMIVGHRERRSGIPQWLSRLGFELEARDLGSTDYVLSPRLAVVRKSDSVLRVWVGLGRLRHGTSALAS